MKHNKNRQNNSRPDRSLLKVNQNNADHQKAYKPEGTKHSGRRLSFGLTILYEDRDIIVVDKPAGLLSIATASEKNRTAHWVLSEYLRKKGEKRRAAVVHRLDRDTSGVMLFAKSEQVKRTLMTRWEELVTERKYAALVEGEVPEDEGIINQPLGEDDRGKIIVTEKGLPSVTRWKCSGKGRGFSFLEVDLETGRRNQIRAHFAWLGFPLAGDIKYGSGKDPLKRLALHAETLKFHHPVTGKLMEFSIPPDKRFSGIPKGK